jgi:hypothetical protein
MHHEPDMISRHALIIGSGVPQFFRFPVRPLDTPFPG